mgnify:CR=1 FL=1
MFEDYDPDDLQVRVAEMLVATADEADHQIDGQIRDVLKLLREKMKMDVVFVSEFTGGRRYFRQVEQVRPVLAEGESDPLEASWCQRGVDGRLPGFVADAAPLVATGALPAPPMPIGTHISTPLTLPGGEVYGTLCCFSFTANPEATEADLRRLRFTADLAGQRIDAGRKALSLQPKADPGGFRTRG